MVELLVGYGADLNIQDHEMATPLHIVTHLTGKNSSDLGLGLSDSSTPDLLKVVLRFVPLLLLSSPEHDICIGAAAGRCPQNAQGCTICRFQDI